MKVGDLVRTVVPGLPDSLGIVVGLGEVDGVADKVWQVMWFNGLYHDKISLFPEWGMEIINESR